MDETHVRGLGLFRVRDVLLSVASCWMAGLSDGQGGRAMNRPSTMDETHVRGLGLFRVRDVLLSVASCWMAGLSEEEARTMHCSWWSVAMIVSVVFMGVSLSSAAGGAPGGQIIRVRPNGSSDSGPGIRAAIERAMAAGTGATVLLEEGTYRVSATSPRGYCFSIQGAKGITVGGAGAKTKIVVTAPDAGAFLVVNSESVTLRDFTIDYEPVPFCQGLIRQVNPDEGWFDLDVAPGYPTPDAPNFVGAMEPYGKWGMILDPAVRRIRAGTIDHFMTPKWEHRGDRVWRFFVNGDHYRWGLRDMRVGDSYVHLARGYGSAILAQGCDGVRIENVTVHASPGLAVGLVGNRGAIVVRGLQVRFPKGSTRLLTTNADGVHCQQNRSGPIIENCYFEGMADDAVNIYAPPNVLLEKRTSSEWLVSSGCSILPGDTLQVLDPRTGRIKSVVKATTVQREGSALRITLEQGCEDAMPGTSHQDGDTLYNLSACGAGFQIRRNRIVGNRRYGCLLRAHSGVVEENVFVDMTGAGVTVVNEPDWPEGPVPFGVTIRRNRFVRGGTCRGYADAEHGQVFIRGVRMGFGLASEPTVRDITVEANTFEDYLGYALVAGAVDRLTVRDNTMKASHAERVRPGSAMAFERCRSVVVADNAVDDRRSNTLSAVEIRPDVVPGDAGCRITGLRAALPADKPVVDDRRR